MFSTVILAVGCIASATMAGAAAYISRKEKESREEAMKNKARDITFDIWMNYTDMKGEFDVYY